MVQYTIDTDGHKFLFKHFLTVEINSFEYFTVLKTDNKIKQAGAELGQAHL